MTGLQKVLALLMLSIAAAADSPAAQAQEATPLPEVVVTSPSPVAKKRGPRKTVKGPARAPAATSSAQQPSAEPPGPITSQPIAEETFAALTLITADDIQAQPGATVTDSLDHKPGVAGSSFAPGANRPVIRGLDNYRVRVQENGIGTHDVSALSEDHAIPVDPFAADRIEVIRGPATLRYGSQAIGGVVSVENQRIPTAIPPGGVSATVKGGLSSGDDGRDGAFSVTSGSGPIAVHADAFKRQSEDYATPRGRQLNSFVDSEGGAVGGSLVGDDGFIGVALAHVTSLYGIPGEDAADHSPRIDMDQSKILAKGEWTVHRGGIEALRFWFGASDYEHEELATEEGTTFVGSRFTNREQEGRVELQHRPVATDLGELSGAVGVQWSNRDVRGQSFEGDSLLEPAETDFLAAFAFEELQFNPALRLQAAARLEHNRVTGVALDDPSDPLTATITEQRSFDPFSTSLGALYALPHGVVARATAQYVERAPDAAELFSKGVHEATGTFEIGDRTLSEEKAQTLEIGLKRSTGRWQFDASLYHTWFDGFIFKRLTGVDCGETLDSCGVEDELRQIVFTQDDARFYGAEFASRYEIDKIWRGTWGIDGQYDFVHASFNGGSNVPRIPPHRVGGGLFYRDANWYARLGLLHALRQDRVAAEETETAGYTLLSAELSYTTKLSHSVLAAPELTIGVRGENLTNEDVRNHVSFKKDEVLEPGASVRLFGVIGLN